MSGRTGQRVAAVHRILVLAVHRKGDVYVLARTERQGRTVAAAEHEGHHAARLGNGLDTFGHELLRMPGAQGAGGPGGCLGAAHDPVPRHLKTANALWFLDGRLSEEFNHAKCSCTRCTYQLMNASTWYSLFMYGPGS